MALANFFNKAALAAAEVLRGIDQETLASILQSHLVGLSFDREAASTSEGQLTLQLCVNLLARLYPRLCLMTDGSDVASAYIPTITSIARSINPDIDIENTNQPTAVLVAGKTRTEESVPTIYMGSNAWIARVSTIEPLSSGNSRVPFGAGAAACLGLAHLFRTLFRDHLNDTNIEKSFSISLFDYQVDPKSNGPLAFGINLEPTHLVGLGAIGNGAVWALAKTPDLSGELHVIDHEVIEISNLQRYVLATQIDVERGLPKVALAEREFSNTSIKVIPHQKKWGEYLREAGNWNLPCVAVALDTAEDRQSVQAALPKYLVNAWTQPVELGVSRHNFVGDDACLTCLYMPDEQTKSRDQIIAEAIGLPDSLMEIRTLLFNRGPIGPDLLSRAAAAMGVPFQELAGFENDSLEDFYTSAICGGLILSLGGRIRPIRLAMPLAFQSALAGILLAAEIVVYSGRFRPEAMPPITRIDLLHPASNKLNHPARKHYSGRCICQDEDYLESYRGKYLSS